MIGELAVYDSCVMGYVFYLCGFYGLGVWYTPFSNYLLFLCRHYLANVLNFASSSFHLSSLI